MAVAEVTTGGRRRHGIAAFFRRSEPARGLALLSPTMIIMGIALAAPLALLAMYSFWTQDGLVLDTRFTLAQYTSAFGRASFRALFFRSLWISSTVTFVTVGLAYPMAYFVAFRVQKAK